MGYTIESHPSSGVNSVISHSDITLLHAYIDDNILYVWDLGVVGKRDVLRFNI